MIKVESLKKVFDPNITAVNSVSFELDKGEIACIIGTSGCGKTTTLKMINRLIEPTSGRILVGGKDALSVGAVNWRRKIGYVIQKAGLLPHLNVKDNISLLSKIMNKEKSFIRERTEELMEIINMPFKQFAHRFPIELSGGQQQRVGIARALMEDPPVLLMDEPFGALDPITRNSLHEEFLDLNEKLHKTIIIVTHDMDEAFKLGHKIILMNKGDIVQIGDKADFLDRPANQFVEDFIQGQAHE
jgi:osmoprotectant transport system ATP-binding protein